MFSFVCEVGALHLFYYLPFNVIVFVLMLKSIQLICIIIIFLFKGWGVDEYLILVSRS